MSNSNSFEELFMEIVEDYFTTFNVAEPIIPNYRVVEDIASEYFALRPNDMEYSSENIKRLNSYNGFALPSKEISGVFTVLINKNTVIKNIKNESMDWVGTIAHETTHVQDYAEYAKIVGAKTYDEILQISEHGMFNLWTEIHARSKGYYFTRKYTLTKEFMASPILLKDIVNREIPTQWQRLYTEYNASVDDSYHQAYLVAQYVGRMYMLQQLYPNDFTDNWIENHFAPNEWMTEWFYFFKKYPVLKEASQHFDEMKQILGQNFQGV